MVVVGLPLPAELAALGPVLCLYRAQHGGELCGWSQAVHACASSGLDSDGLREQVLFFDRDGRCCWRLCLLPDSDFLAWEEMAARLPAAAAGGRSGGVGERLWRRLAGRLRGERWHASILRLHVLAAAQRHGQAAQSGALAAGLATLSPLGASTARRIAREESVDAEGIVATDDGRCRRAVPTAVPVATHLPGQARDNVIPLFRFNPGAQA